MQQKIIDFKNYSSIKIGNKIPVSILSFESLCVKLQDSKTIHFNSPFNDSKKSFLESKDSTLRVIGLANNLLVSNDAKNLAILSNDFNYISDLGDSIEIGASTPSLKIFNYFKNNDLAGVEFLKNLPGNLGALCNMNAGMKSYEIKENLSSLNINGKWIDIKEAGLRYRDRDSAGVIFSARFYKKKGFRHELLEIFSQMRKTHPRQPSCGSCFKNPPNNYAGKLLQDCKLKGYRINDAAFSEEHANFLVNLGNASFEDALNLIQLAKKRVFEESGIMLECEVKICK